MPTSVHVYLLMPHMPALYITRRCSMKKNYGMKMESVLSLSLLLIFLQSKARKIAMHKECALSNIHEARTYSITIMLGWDREIYYFPFQTKCGPYSIRQWWRLGFTTLQHLPPDKAQDLVAVWCCQHWCWLCTYICEHMMIKIELCSSVLFLASCDL